MKPDQIFKSIAVTVNNPDDPYARKSDCHCTTAEYVKSGESEGSDGIILYDGSWEGHVAHSIVIDKNQEIVSDSFKDHLVSFNKETLEITYKIKDGERTLKPLAAITVRDFKSRFLDIKESFKEFLQQ